VSKLRQIVKEVLFRDHATLISQSVAYKVKKMNKKAALEGEKLVEYTLLFLLLALVVWGLVKPLFSSTKDFLTKSQIETNLMGCNTELPKAQLLGIQPQMCGHPKYPIDCNPCIGNVAADAQDTNSNLMPDICEKQPLGHDPNKIDCDWWYSKTQCCVKDKVNAAGIINCGKDSEGKPIDIQCFTKDKLPKS